jgi:glutathione peroxidase
MSWALQSGETVMATAFKSVLASVFIAILWATPAASRAADNAHEFAFTSIEGEPMPLSAFEGKAILIVNTASQCGFTRQYEGLQSLWDRYRERGLVVLGVPSNDFGGQEPGNEGEIKEFCEVNFNVDFPLTAKQHVTGPDAHPFYHWTGQQLGDDAKPRWNFHKYLVAPDGRLAGWFPTQTEPLSEPLVQAVESTLPPQ